MEINKDVVPSTIKDAVIQILASLNEEDKEFIRKHPSCSIHHGTGTWFRNNWSLWEDSPLKRDAISKYKIAHADDISGLIFDWVWAKVRGEKFDPVVYCERFHKHWAKFGKTSLQAGGVN